MNNGSKLAVVDASNQRSRCQRCYRPASHCLCSYVTRVDNSTRVLVLQHPEESKHALNTGRLAVMGLKRAKLLVGEHFPQIEALIAAEAAVYLLFPGEQAQVPEPLGDRFGQAPPLLIVPDGTWRKARKILWKNPVLSRLPRLSRPAGEASRYRLRATRQPNAVSTIEAIVGTLKALEPQQDFEPVFRPFDALIEQQIEAMGEQVYQRNYPKQT